MSAPVPDVLGTPPEPHRSALVDRERVRGTPPHPLSQWRTLIAVVAGVIAEVLLAVVAGVWSLDPGVVATIATGIPVCVWGNAWKSAREHALRGPV